MGTAAAAAAAAAVAVAVTAVAIAAETATGRTPAAASSDEFGSCTGFEREIGATPADTTDGDVGNDGACISEKLSVRGIATLADTLAGTETRTKEAVGMGLAGCGDSLLPPSCLFFDEGGAQNSSMPSFLRLWC